MDGKRLKALREENGLTQKELADKLSLTPKAISFYELGSREPSGEVLIKMAHILHTTTDYLLGDTKIKSPEYNHKGVRIPVLGRVVAGIPIEAIQEVLDYEEISESMANTGEFFALQVHGASMEPTLKDGDIVIVRKQPTVNSGEIAIVLVNGNDATVKEIKESSSGITLIGHNVAVFTPQFYSNKEIEQLPVQIIGRVVEMRRKL